MVFEETQGLHVEILVLQQLSIFVSAFAFFPIFAILRLQPINDRIYFPKWYLKGIRNSPRHSGNIVTKFVNCDFRTYVRSLNWMPAALRMPEPELIDHAGLDSAIINVYHQEYKTGAAFWSDVQRPLIIAMIVAQLLLMGLDAMGKDTLEQATEPNLNLKAYLQDAYIHPVFKKEDIECPVAFGEKETNTLVPTKRISDKTTPAERKHGSEAGLDIDF